MTFGTSILIVDDDSQIRKIQSEILENEGYIIHTAKNGKQATNLSKELHFDIALVDIGLPDIRGIDLLQRLKFLQPKIMTIIVTGSSAIEDTIDAVNKGTDGYILKPVHAKKLLELIENLLKEKTTHEILDWVNINKSNKEQTDLLSHYKSPRKPKKTPW